MRREEDLRRMLRCTQEYEPPALLSAPPEQANFSFRSVGVLVVPVVPVLSVLFAAASSQIRLQFEN